MQKDFKTLFQRWQSQEATDDETTELQEMLNSEKYQDELKSLLSDTSVSGAYDEEISDERKRVLLRSVMHAIQKKEHSGNRRYGLGGVFAVAATIALAVVAGLWILNPDVISRQAEAEIVKAVDRRFIKLPDGTSVTLNEGSTLTYSTAEFGEEVREVSLSGEAFFDVTHVPNRPFIVRTNQIHTTVLGTAFNIKAYQDHPIVVTVMRGKVKVSSPSKDFDLLLPNQEIAVNLKNLTFEKRNVQADKSVTWKENYLILDNVTMKEAASIISKRYHIQVNLADSSLTDCRISIFFVKNESLARVLETVSLAKNGTYFIKDTIATIHGACE